MKPVIGIFDSGVGGVMAATALHQACPYLDIVILADTLHMPYGVKTETELIALTKNNIAYLKSQGCTTLIAACNTVSAVALPHIEADVCGTIELTVKQIGRHQSILIIATEATVQSKAYTNALRRQQYEGDITECATPTFVTMVEHHQIDYHKIKDVMSPYIGKVDALVLGCTHFVALKKVLQDIMGDIKIYDSTKPLIEFVKKMCPDTKSYGQLRCLTTKKTDDFKAAVQMVSNVNVLIEEIVL